MSDIELDGHRIREFLKDDVVKAALQVLKERSYTDFLTAKTHDERLNAQAEALVLDRFVVALQSVADAGERASIERERREHAPATRPTE
jgi:hypothetical protein